MKVKKATTSPAFLQHQMALLAARVGSRRRSRIFPTTTGAGAALTGRLRHPRPSLNPRGRANPIPQRKNQSWIKLGANVTIEPLGGRGRGPK
jgi:hypothetical protein